MLAMKKKICTLFFNLQPIVFIGITNKYIASITYNLMTMQIRPATPQDKPAMIGLLKKSLGEGMIPKSEALWDWKHEQNPFGASFVLLAEENGVLIGLRAFMQWQWKW